MSCVFSGLTHTLTKLLFGLVNVLVGTGGVLAQIGMLNAPDMSNSGVTDDFIPIFRSWRS